jgi:hypothetical protein
MHMLDWFKRIVTPVFHKQLVENENKTLPAAENVERLVDRLGTFSAAASQLAERFTQTDVIAVACQKSGSGKSTIAAHLAVQAGRVARPSPIKMARRAKSHFSSSSMALHPVPTSPLKRSQRSPSMAGWRPPFYQRTDYAASMIEGRTVMETVPAGRSAQEIAGVWKYVYSQISIRAAA